MSKISENFSVNEFFVSDQRPDLVSTSYQKFGIDQQNRIKQVVLSILQPARTEFNSAFKVLSGFRTQQLNSAIGGSATSDHLYGLAVDFTTSNLLGVFYWLYHTKKPYRQLIYYPDQKFIHVSTNMPGRDYKNEALVKYLGDNNYYQFYGSRLPR